MRRHLQGCQSDLPERPTGPFVVPFLLLGLLAWAGCAPAPAGEPAAPTETAEAARVAGAPAVLPDGGAEAGRALRAEMATLVGYYHSIALTPEQAALKAEALGPIPAPCCADFSAATCCCPCNLAKAIWGLSHQLIAAGAGVDDVRTGVEEWLEKANPEGFAGNACYLPGGCARPVHQDGCGGMTEAALAG